MAFARALRTGFDSIRETFAAATFAFGIAKLDAEAFGWVVDAAAEDDEAAANWGADDGCDAKISSTTANFATFATFDCFDADMATARKKAQESDEKDGNRVARKHEKT